MARTEVDILLKFQSSLAGLSEARAGFTAFRRQLDSLSSAVLGFGLGAGGLAGLAAAAKSVVDYGSSIVDAATRAGISTDAFQTLALTAKESGLGFDDVSTALAAMRKNLADAAAGSKGMQAALAELGLSAKFLQTLAPERQFEVIAAAIARAEDQTRAYAAAADLLGAKNLPKLQEVLQRVARDGVSGLADAFKNGIIPESELKVLAEAGDKLDYILHRLKMIGAQVIVGAAKPSPTYAATLDQAIKNVEANLASIDPNSFLAGFRRARDEKELARLRGLRGAVPSETSAASAPAAAVANQKLLDQAKAAADLESFELERLRNLAAAKKLNTEETKELAAAARTQGEATAQAARNYQRELETLAETTKDALDVTRPFYRQLDDLAEAYRRDLLSAEQFAAAVERTNEAMRDTAIRDYFKDLDAAEDKLRGTARETDDTAQQLGMTFASAFEDAIVKGESLREVLKGIAQDILRIAIRKAITEPIGDALGDFFGSLFTSGAGKASGGPVAAGAVYPIHEAGLPEFFKPATAGTVIPLSQVPAGAMGSTVNIAYNFEAGVTRDELAALLPELERRTKAGVADALRRRDPGFRV